MSASEFLFRIAKLVFAMLRRGDYMISKEAFEYLRNNGIMEDKNMRQYFIEKFNEVCLKDYPVSFDIVKDAESSFYFLIPSDIKKDEPFPDDKLNYIVRIPGDVGDMISLYIKRITTYAERIFGAKRPSRILSEVFYGLYLHGILKNFFDFKTDMPVESTMRHTALKSENVLFPIRYSPMAIDAKEFSASRFSMAGIRFTEGYADKEPDDDFEAYFMKFADAVSFGQTFLGSMDIGSLPAYYIGIINDALENKVNESSHIIYKKEEPVADDIDFDELMSDIRTLSERINHDRYKNYDYDYYTDIRRVDLYKLMGKYLIAKGITKLAVIKTNQPDIIMILPYSYIGLSLASFTKEHADCIAYVDRSVYDSVKEDIRSPSLKRIYFMSVLYNFTSIDSRAPFITNTSRLDELEFDLSERSLIIENISVNNYFDYETDDYYFDRNSLSKFETDTLFQDKLAKFEDKYVFYNVSGIGHIEYDGHEVIVKVPVIISDRTILLRFRSFDERVVYDNLTGEFACDVSCKDGYVSCEINDAVHEMFIDDFKTLLYESQKKVSYVTGFVRCELDGDVEFRHLYFPQGNLFAYVHKDFVSIGPDGIYGICWVYDKNHIQVYEEDGNDCVLKDMNLDNIKELLNNY